MTEIVELASSRSSADLSVNQVQGGDPGVPNAPTGVMPKPEPELELGVGMNMPFSIPYSGPGSEDEQLFESVRPLGSDEGPSVAQLEAMRRMDGQARALYRLITEPIRSAMRNAAITPAEGGEKEAEFIDQLLNTPATNGGMLIPFKRVMAQLMLGVFDGFSPFEIVYWSPKTGPLKGKWTIKKLAYRPAATISFLTDLHGTFQGFRQRTFFAGRTIDVHIEENAAFYYAANEEERPFYGISYFQAAFYHYDKKMKLYYIAHLAAQRAATGLRVGRMPGGASTQDKNRFLKGMADLGIAQYMVVPGTQAEGWDLEVVKDGPSFDYLSYINHQNSQMSKSLLAPWFDQNQGSGQGDASVINSMPTDSSHGMFTAMIKAIMDELQDIINNDLIPRFIDWNFNSGKYPTWAFGTFTDEQEEAIDEIFSKLASVAQASLSVTPEFMRALEEHMAEELGLEIDYDAVAEREAAQQQLSQQMQEAQLQNMQGSPPDTGGEGGQGGSVDGNPPGGGGGLGAKAAAARNGAPERASSADKAALSADPVLRLAYELLEEAVLG